VFKQFHQKLNFNYEKMKNNVDDLSTFLNKVVGFGTKHFCWKRKGGWVLLLRRLRFMKWVF